MLSAANEKNRNQCIRCGIQLECYKGTEYTEMLRLVFRLQALRSDDTSVEIKYNSCLSAIATKICAVTGSSFAIMATFIPHTGDHILTPVWGAAVASQLRLCII